MNNWTYTKDNEPKPDRWDSMTEQQMQEYLASAFMYEDLQEFLWNYMQPFIPHRIDGTDTSPQEFSLALAEGIRESFECGLEGFCHPDSRLDDLIDKAESGEVDMHYLVSTVQSWLRSQVHEPYDGTYKNTTRMEPQRTLIIDFGDWIMEGDMSDLVSDADMVIKAE